MALSNDAQAAISTNPSVDPATALSEADGRFAHGYELTTVVGKPPPRFSFRVHGL